MRTFDEVVDELFKPDRNLYWIITITTRSSEEIWHIG